MKIKFLKNEIVFLVGIGIIHFCFILFLQSILSPIHFKAQNFFVLELLGKTGYISNDLLIVLELANLILLWLISKRFFSSYFSLLPPFIYAISPWSSYLVVAGSFYIYLLFLTLLMIYGLLVVKTENSFWGLILAIGAAILTIYSSLILFVLVPIILCLLLVFKIILSKKFKFSLIILIALLIPLIFLAGQKFVALKNISKNEIGIFADPGLINNVNRYQGQANAQGLDKIAKVSENKYIFQLEFFLIKYTKQLIPSTFFTSQERLLNFSFSSPIYLGFLIAFFYGLYLVFKLRWQRFFFIATLLVVPSVLSQKSVDLNRLILFYPVILFLISFGIVELYHRKNQKVIKFFLSLTLMLVIFQALITITDIRLKEKSRFERYYNQEYQLDKQ